MTMRLTDLAPCFEGVIPSIIATAAADGTPNVSYLSHVARVDDSHIALSNQFFAKTAANIRANPWATLILVDCFTGDQYLLDIRFVRSVDVGPLFDKIALQLKASSAQLGMEDIMRLKSADVFRVEAIEKVPSPVETAWAADDREPVDLPALSNATRAIEQQAEIDNVVDHLLHSVRDVLSFSHALVLFPDAGRGCFVTAGSMGYPRSGLGSEAPADTGLIGLAAKNAMAIKVSDASRIRRMGEAIGQDEGISENRSRSIMFPELPGAMSQIAIPMIAQGETVGILFAESTARMAFRDQDEAAMDILAAAAARAIRACDREEEKIEALPVIGEEVAETAAGSVIHVMHYRHDDSVFVDGEYVIKGIAGAVLRQMLERHRETGRSEFSNRELRLALAARMPDIKDNLETRLLLLRRRLEEKRAPIQVIRIGRGRLQLFTKGQVVITASQEY